MVCSFRKLLFFAFACGFVQNGISQIQDKEQSKAMVELAGEMLKASQAKDDVRDIMVQAADLDTTNLFANYEAGRLHLKTIKKDHASKFLLRVYHQDPNYRFDIEYRIALSFQYGLQFDKAIRFYNRYKLKLQRQPDYRGKDKVRMVDVERRLYECTNGKEFLNNPKSVDIVNIGSDVNSDAHDYTPVLNEKEDKIIFTSRRIDGNLNENVSSDNKPYEDIFISTKVNGKWTRAVNIGQTVNIPDHNSNVALSPDGKYLFTYRVENGGDIYVSELKKDNTWTPPKPLPGVINSPYMESSVSVSRDGNILYFASERPDGFGGLDIYVCTKDSRGNWGNVKNLGPTINTEKDEDGPFIDYSGKKLFFSSEGHKGMGGYDIFESTLINPARNEWSTPLNIGYPINTPDNDICYVGVSDGKRGYYSSVRDDGLGALDIYEIGPKDLTKKTESTLLPVKLAVKAIDAQTNTPLDANIELLSLAESTPVPVLTKTNGNYIFSVVTRDPKKYLLSVSLKGYFPQMDEISLQSVDMVEKTVTRTVGMVKSEKEYTITPLKYQVTVVDAQTNQLLDSKVKLEVIPENNPITPTSKGSGTVEFSIVSPQTKKYKLTIECPGYSSQSQVVKLEGAGLEEKTISQAIRLLGDGYDNDNLPLTTTSIGTGMEFPPNQKQSHYVVIGAFAKENNAKKFSGYVRSRFFQSTYDLNPSRNLYYVYVVKTEIRKEAVVQTKILQSDEEFRDSWIYTGSLRGSSQWGSSPESKVVRVKTKPLPQAIDNTATGADVKSTPDETSADISEKDLTVGSTFEKEKAVAEKLFRFDILSPTGEPIIGDVHHVDLRKGLSIGTYSNSENCYVPKPQEDKNPMTMTCGVFGYKEMTKLIDYYDPSQTDGVYRDEENAWVVPFKLERLKKRDESVMYGVSFYKDAVIMEPHSQKELNELVNMMKTNPAYKIEIHGYTNGKQKREIVFRQKAENYFDLEGSAKKSGSDTELSKLRAEAIRDYLTDQGIEKSRMSVKAHGGSGMIVEESSPSAKLNDRIEIKIVGD